ncbi:MAG: RNA polymerase sigma-54 factor [Candidatus Omnitrophota bacterium]|nr:MAG: RNA polymerase sigma-54 factor [Candidatus Omnitrophota bacterium]
MEIKQTQKLTQRLALTPQMRQSLYILQLPLLELKSYIENQVEENPVLEYEYSSKESPKYEEESSLEKIEKLIKIGEEERENIATYAYEYTSEEIRKKQNYKETLLTKEITLYEHLLRQLRIYPLKKWELEIGEFIIGNIDEDGYLRISIDEIITSLKESKLADSETITKESVERILRLIQSFDPVGVGARNLKECLLIQLKARNTQNSLVYKIVEGYLPEIAKNRIKFIAQRLKKSPQKIKEAIKIISHLEPKPGRRYSQEKRSYITSSVPDVIIEKINNKYEVIVNTKGLPPLKINNQYKALLKSNKVSKEIKEYIRTQLNSALWLIKAILQREKTIRKIVECLIQVQREFFERGDPSLIKPLTLKEIGKIIKRSESTISRVVNNKYIQTPFGIFRLDTFFTKHLSTIKGEKIPTHNIKSFISHLIEEESPKNPLKDGEIAKLLRKEGIKIARRTVAKYREELKIPPSHLRKR